MYLAEHEEKEYREKTRGGRENEKRRLRETRGHIYAKFDEGTEGKAKMIGLSLGAVRRQEKRLIDHPL